MSGFYPTQDVREAAQGNWIAILATMQRLQQLCISVLATGTVLCLSYEQWPTAQAGRPRQE